MHHYTKFICNNNHAESFHSHLRCSKASGSHSGWSDDNKMICLSRERQQFKGDGSSSEINISPNEGTEETKNKTKKNAKRKDVEEVSGTEG